LLLAYRTSVPIISIRHTLVYTMLVALPFMILGGIASLWPNLTLKLKVLWTLYIWVTILLAITLWAYLRTMVILSQKKDAPEEDHHYLQQLDAKFYGISRKLLYVETELFNEGYTTSKHRIELTSTTDKVYSIEHSSTLPHAPLDGDRPIDLQVPDQLIDEVKLKPVILSLSKNKLFWQLNFLPCLPKGKKVHYNYSETSPRGSFAMTFEELKNRKMDYEYFSMRISYPTEHYKQKLIFPVKFDPTYYDYDVWLGEGKVQHPEEFHRLRNFWHVGREKDGRMYIEISIKHPIHGLIYALKWIPPA